MDKNKLAISTYDKIAQAYTDRYFDDLSDSQYIDKFLAALPPRGRVLDVGCGPGIFSKYMSKKGFDVTGIDFSTEMLKIARNRVPKVKFQFMDMRKLDFPQNFFDGLLVAYSLIHIPSAQTLKTLGGFFRVLKPGGTLMVIALVGEPDRTVDEPLGGNVKMFVNFFTKVTIATALEKAGFGVFYLEEKSNPDLDSFSDKIIYAISQKPAKA